MQLVTFVVAIGLFASIGTGDEAITVERDVAAPMRDGSVLRANVFRPSTGGPYPVLVWRTPCFSPDGKFLTGIGDEGAEAGEFIIPHGLAIDSHGVVVRRRCQRNQRVQVFEPQ